MAEKVMVQGESTGGSNGWKVSDSWGEVMDGEVIVGAVMAGGGMQGEGWRGWVGIEGSDGWRGSDGGK